MVRILKSFLLVKMVVSTGGTRRRSTAGRPGTCIAFAPSLGHIQRLAVQPESPERRGRKGGAERRERSRSCIAFARLTLL